MSRNNEAGRKPIRNQSVTKGKPVFSQLEAGDTEMAIRRDLVLTAVVSSILTTNTLLVGFAAIFWLNGSRRSFHSEAAVDYGEGVDDGSTGNNGGQPYIDMPWNLVDVLRSMSVPEKIETLEADVEFYDDVPPSSRFFLAPINICFNDRGFCFGAVTSLDLPLKDGTNLCRERGFVFTRWGDTNIGAIRPAPGGYTTATEQGGGRVSVGLPYPWTKGRYTFRLQRSKSESGGSSGSSAVEAYVYSHATKTRSFIGALQFPGTELKHTNEVIGAFAQIYDIDRKAMPAPFPPMGIGMGDVHVNGVLRTPDRVEAVFEAGVPKFASAFGKDDRSPRLLDLNRSFPSEAGAFLISLDMNTVRSDARCSPLYSRK
jgi:hypothetical protein